MKINYRGLALALLLPLPAPGLQLDCEDHGDGTYTCVEIGSDRIKGSPTSGSPSPQAQRASPAYVSQAEEECEARLRPRRAGGKGTSGAVRLEARKRAQEDYDRCVTERAAELERAAEAAR